MITNKTQFYPSTVAPNPMEVDYWIDTKTDPNGTVIKTWNGKEWQQITDTTTDDSEIKDLKSQIESINTTMNTKVDKVEGKSLSTNDYTTEEKTKLAGIAANANNYTLPAATEEQLGGIKKISFWQQFADSDDLATVITKLKSLCSNLQSAGILGSPDPIV